MQYIITCVKSFLYFIGLNIIFKRIKKFMVVIQHSYNFVCMYTIKNTRKHTLAANDVSLDQHFK